MATTTDAGQASLHDSPVQDAVAKIAMDPKLTNAMIADRVRSKVKGSLATATAKSVATQVRILRQRGVAIPPRARQPQSMRAHAA